MLPQIRGALPAYATEHVDAVLDTLVDPDSWFEASVVAPDHLAKFAQRSYGWAGEGVLGARRLRRSITKPAQSPLADTWVGGSLSHRDIRRPTGMLVPSPIVAPPRPVLTWTPSSVLPGSARAPASDGEGGAGRQANRVMSPGALSSQASRDIAGVTATVCAAMRRAGARLRIVSVWGR